MYGCGFGSVILYWVWVSDSVCVRVWFGIVDSVVGLKIIVDWVVGLKIIVDLVVGGINFGCGFYTTFEIYLLAWFCLE